MRSFTPGYALSLDVVWVPVGWVDIGSLVGCSTHSEVLAQLQIQSYNSLSNLPQSLNSVKQVTLAACGNTDCPTGGVTLVARGSPDCPNGSMEKGKKEHSDKLPNIVVALGGRLFKWGSPQNGFGVPLGLPLKPPTTGTFKSNTPRE